MTEPANPFERFGIDPREGRLAITERLRELAEDAPSAAARDAVRAAWEELTMHPARRLRAALGAAPETRPSLGQAPRAPRTADAPLSLADLAPLPSVVAALDGAPPGARGLELEALALPSFTDDPVLARATLPGDPQRKKARNVL